MKCTLPTRASLGVLLLLVLCGPGMAGGLACDGVDDVGDFVNEAAFDFVNTTFTVCLWLDGTWSATRGLLSKDNGAAGGWSVLANASGSISGFIKDSAFASTASRASSATLNDGALHHVCIVFTTDTTTNANNTQSIYVDGALSQGSQFHSGSLGYSPNNDALRLCRRNASGYFPGTIYALSIHNRALTNAEVTLLFSGRLRVPSKALGTVTQLTFTQCGPGMSCHGTVIQDLSGNGNTLTVDDGANNTGMTGTGTGFLTATGVSR